MQILMSRYDFVECVHPLARKVYFIEAELEFVWLLKLQYDCPEPGFNVQQAGSAVAAQAPTGVHGLRSCAVTPCHGV